MKNTRQFKKVFEMNDFLDAFTLAQELLIQIDAYFSEKNISPFKKEFLVKSKKYIEQLLTKYGDPVKLYMQIDNEIITYGLQHANEIGFGENAMQKAADASQILRDVKANFNRVFKIEDTIHEHITIPLWKQNITPADFELKSGDEFLYIVHSGLGMIQLPGFPGYRKKYEFDYVSASLLSEKQMAMFNSSRVGLILKPNEAIVCSTRNDSGSHYVGNKSVRTILALNDTNAIESGIPATLSRRKRRNNN